MLQLARFLGIAEDSGNEFTYYIRTKEKKSKILIYSNIKTRRTNIGTENESILNDPMDFIMWLESLIDRKDIIKDLEILMLFHNILPPLPNYLIPDGILLANITINYKSFCI